MNDKFTFLKPNKPCRQVWKVNGDTPLTLVRDFDGIRLDM